MQQANFSKYIENPVSLDKQSVSDLLKLVEEFPYFQTAHMLLSLAGKKHDASVFQQSLRKSAILATNRTQLFNLVQAMELSSVENGEAPVKQSEIIGVEEVNEDRVAREMEVLKAAELSTETVAEINSPEIKPKIAPEEQLEKEIGKQLVNAFVEKEILKIPDLHKPVAKEEPESFGDWLLFLKKNNGQPYHQISDEVVKGKIKSEEKIRTLEENKQAAKGQKNESSEKPDRKTRNMAIIEKIIEDNPGHIRHKEEQKFYAPDAKAKESLLENEHLVTETLARIYAMQGSVNKAIRAYQILSLKYPQKSAYFASLIEKLKNNQ